MVEKLKDIGEKVYLTAQAELFNTMEITMREM